MKRHRDETPASDWSAESLGFLPCKAVSITDELETLKCELAQGHSGYHVHTIYWGGASGGIEKG